MLVVLELGAQWPASLVEATTHSPRRVLVEVEGEGPTAFAARVTATVASLFPRGTALGAVFVSCNERADESASRARREIGRAVLPRLGAEEARLIFAGTERSGERLKASLAALVTDLGGAKGSEGRAVAAFGRSAPAAGVAVQRVA